MDNNAYVRKSIIGLKVFVENVRNLLLLTAHIASVKSVFSLSLIVYVFLAIRAVRNAQDPKLMNACLVWRISLKSLMEFARRKLFVLKIISKKTMLVLSVQSLAWSARTKHYVRNVKKDFKLFKAKLDRSARMSVEMGKDSL